MLNHPLQSCDFTPRESKEHPGPWITGLCLEICVANSRALRISGGAGGRYFTSLKEELIDALQNYIGSIDLSSDILKASGLEYQYRKYEH